METYRPTKQRKHEQACISQQPCKHHIQANQTTTKQFTQIQVRPQSRVLTVVIMVILYKYIYIHTHTY